MQASTCPALLIAAPASGQGKTSVTAALAHLHARRGRRVRVFKCGPDFLDPQWLALASGQPVDNLDLWMNGEADVRARLTRAAAQADLILIEGVMGLFDGQPSAADLAQRLGIPVLAVEASAMAGTFGALVHGLRRYRPGLPWAGVLANRVAGAGHAQMLQRALRDGDGPWWGALPHREGFALPQRHLGLTLWLTQLGWPPTQPCVAACVAAGRGATTGEPATEEATTALLAALDEVSGPVVLVSHEIGLGVILLGADVRAFVDTLGQLNQRVAQACERVTLMVAGYPLTVKDAA